MLDRAVCARRLSGGSLPHPVAAVILFPSGQPAVAELQEQPVVMVDQPAAAEIAQRQVDLVARRTYCSGCPRACDVCSTFIPTTSGLLFESVAVNGRRGTPSGVNCGAWARACPASSISASSKAAADRFIIAPAFPRSRRAAGCRGRATLRR